MPKRLFVALSVYCLLSTNLFAYTSPGQPTGFVNDFAGILRTDTVTTLEQSLSTFSKETGHEISIVTIKSLGDETVETYAEKLFQEWGIGKAETDNGLLLLVAPDERAMRIEVGYGLEPVVTDIESGRIIRETLTPAFQSGDYDAGITQAAAQMMLLARGEVLPESTSRKGIDWTEIAPYLFFVLIYGSSLLARSKSWWAGGVIGAIFGAAFFSWVFIIILGLVGLLFDFVVSRAYSKSKTQGIDPPWWIGGGHHGGGGGGFGGFGGGMSGGGGASGRW